MALLPEMHIDGHCVCVGVFKQRKRHSIGPKQGGGENEEQVNGGSCCHYQDIHCNIKSSLLNHFTHTHTHTQCQTIGKHFNAAFVRVVMSCWLGEKEKSPVTVSQC